MFDIFGQVALAVADVEVAGPEVDLDIVRRGELEQVRLGFLGDVEQRLGAFESEPFSSSSAPARWPVPSWPPLRPDAPSPMRLPSISATLVPALARCVAADNPVKPPPTMTTSTVRSPSSGA
jgi:hypothetical protein